MNQKHIKALYGVKLVKVSFDFRPATNFTKTYDFVSVLPNLKPGQEVVVQCGGENGLQFKAAQVVKVLPKSAIQENPPFQYRFALSNTGQGAKESLEAIKNTLEAITLLK